MKSPSAVAIRKLRGWSADRWRPLRASIHASPKPQNIRVILQHSKERHEEPFEAIERPLAVERPCHRVESAVHPHFEFERVCRVPCSDIGRDLRQVKEAALKNSCEEDLPVVVRKGKRQRSGCADVAVGAPKRIHILVVTALVVEAKGEIVRRRTGLERKCDDA